jgi:predicted O-methyltransferase YrrM
MSDWSDGYVTNVEYTAHFYPYLSPGAQNFSLLLNGFMPAGDAGGYTYCELGCGQGYSTALLAAANPAGRFWGVDFNPSHIAGATRLASAAGIDNVTFLEKSFAELTGAGLPQMDFIALHGVWSWINTDNRKAIADFIYANLKPGGCVYISYNALPGWAAIAPLRQIFTESQRGKTSLDAKSVDEALALAQKLKTLGAGYFAANSSGGANLDLLAKQQHNYLLHEYFNRDWTPFYFSTVADDLKAAKLSFACSSDITEHLDQLCITKDAQTMLAEIADPIARETIRDYFRNQRFRRDLFTRGARKLNPAERIAMMRDLPLALIGPKPEFPLRANFPAGTITMNAEPFASLVEALAAGPQTLGQLSALPAVTGSGGQAVFQAVLLLLASGRVQPAAGANDVAARRQRTDRFNRAVIMQAPGLEAQTLASPVLGNGVVVPRIDQLFLAFEMQHPGLPASEIVAQMQARKMAITSEKDGEGGLPDDPAKRTETVLADFRAQRLPAYRRLGLL